MKKIIINKSHQIIERAIQIYKLNTYLFRIRLKHLLNAK